MISGENFEGFQIMPKTLNLRDFIQCHKILTDFMRFIKFEHIVNMCIWMVLNFSFFHFSFMVLKRIHGISQFGILQFFTEFKGVLINLIDC